MRPMRDEDEEKDDILNGLSGEVDDYAGSKLKDPNEKNVSAGGVTVTISVAPDASQKKDEETDDSDDGDTDGTGMEADSEKHDPIAHILGMCAGGCDK